MVTIGPPQGPSYASFPYSETLRNISSSPQVTRIKEVAGDVFSKIASSWQVLYKPSSERNIKSTGMLACVYLVVFLCFCIPLIVIVHRVRRGSNNSPPSSPPPSSPPPSSPPPAGS